MIVHYGRYGRFRFNGAPPAMPPLHWIPVFSLTGPDVVDLQIRLNQLGVSTPMNGVFDQQTMASVSKFQTAYALPVTGVMDQGSWDKLYDETSSLGMALQTTASSAAKTTSAAANNAAAAPAQPSSPAAVSPPPPTAPNGGGGGGSGGGGGGGAAKSGGGAGKTAATFPWGYVVLGVGALGLGLAALMPTRSRR